MKELHITTNIPPRVPNIIFSLDQFISFRDTVLPLKEAVNMLTTTLTENGSAAFTWLGSTNPDLTGYGIEIERSILGYDADSQDNELIDVTIILLPPTASGNAPKVYVGEKEVCTKQLGDEVLKARRRSRALEKEILPEVLREKQHIKESLDMRSRETFVRTKKIKAMTGS